MSDKEPATIRELFFYMRGEFLKELSDDFVKKIMEHQEDCYAIKKIKSHVKSHWKIAGIAIGAPSVILAIIELCRKVKGL